MAFSFLMATVQFSIIVPVYNRPKEVAELFESLSQQSYKQSFEVVLIEDGSNQTSDLIVEQYAERLDITYLRKPNTGPGDSRNYGMERAKGNYFIIFDSECIIPPEYLETVERVLSDRFVACFGGPDRAHPSFNALQKAIDYCMTSWLTTGGIRGGKKAVDRFQPRSFNMGLSKEAFESTGGFGNIHPGEDPDLVFRLWQKGFQTSLVPEAYVYHKRRIDFRRFYRQVYRFGSVRPILNQWHPHTAKPTYWFPTVFIFGFALGLVLGWSGFWSICWSYALYGLLLLLDAFLRTRSLLTAGLVLLAAPIQFFGYGLGFLKSTILVNFSKRPAEELLPHLFFKKRKS